MKNKGQIEVQDRFHGYFYSATGMACISLDTHSNNAMIKFGMAGSRNIRGLSPVSRIVLFCLGFLEARYLCRSSQGPNVMSANYFLVSPTP